MFSLCKYTAGSTLSEGCAVRYSDLEKHFGKYSASCIFGREEIYLNIFLSIFFEISSNLCLLWCCGVNFVLKISLVKRGNIFLGMGCKLVKSKTCEDFNI
jgi:hypothetical protein